MSTFLLFNNLHFSFEILGALIFLMITWLALDAFLIRRDFLTISRGIGFLFLAVYQVTHAFYDTSDLAGYWGYLSYGIGIVFVAWNFFLEAPIKRPEFKAILALPALASVKASLDFFIVAGLAAIAFFSFRQYRLEFKKTLIPFWIGFLCLAAGAFISIFYRHDAIGFVWVAGHLLELLGFFALGWWVWSYLKLRIREEMLLIFISVTLFMAVVVGLAFSNVLIKRVEDQTIRDLLTNAKVLEYAIGGLQEEALAKTKFLSLREDIASAVLKHNFLKLEQLAGPLLEQEKLGFLAFLNAEGDVLVRAHALTKKDDNLSGEHAVRSARDGTALVTIESSPVEGFSIRAASPLRLNGKIVGILVAGFPLDNAFVDSVKRITGLEMSLFEGDTRVATTAFNPDGRTRSIGIKQLDPLVRTRVLEAGGEVTLRTTILSRPFLASYLPIQNTAGEVVGMISAAKSQRETLETIQATNRLTLIAVMVLMLIFTIPLYFLTQRLTGEVYASGRQGV